MTSTRMLSMRKYSGILNVTGREIQPRGMTGTGPTLENGCDGWSFDIKICILLKATRLMWLSTAPPSIRMWHSLMLVTDEHRYFHDSGHWSVTPYIHRRDVCCIVVRCSSVRVSLRILTHVWPFIAQSHVNYTVTQGPTGGPGVVGSMCNRALLARSSK
jgi:hypothetical protein